MCLQQPIPRSKSLYHHFQLSQSPRATQRCRSFPPYSGFDRLYTYENPSSSSLLTEGIHDDNNNNYASHQVGSDVFIPSRSSLHCTGPHADGDYQEQDNVACVGSNPTEDVAISVGDLDAENTVFVQAHSRPRVTPSGCIFILNSIGLEILSAGFDQVSSPRKPLYALISLLLAIVGVVTCIWELIHGQMKEKGKDASSNSMVYRSLPDIFGLGLAVIQCVCSAEQYYFHHQQTGNPLRLSPVALYFYVCLVVLKYNWRV
ncbi:hypothetical protein D8674_038752 [Pyrus ussuriensis x Pyrus communis]|uniref:Uncharacterized protein n=1 Tax=Pyrus ussuriensis x Pyrus communis TaxID=2448454 RepID=A0A5N5G0C4_9ROSA|nr:hypothetical protein D8674_038752 [Pyrus ussuriensis x Pyrus communis]